MRLSMTRTARPMMLLVTAAYLVGTTARAETSGAPTAVASSAAASTRKAPPPRPFVPRAFRVPTLVVAKDFKLVPLGPDVVGIDYAAYMSSIDHLQTTFTRSTDWPHAGISAADAMRDMEAEQARFRERASFAYAVLSSDGRRERGSVYVAPSPVAGHDAVVRLWVTKAEHDAGFDATLFAWVTAWMRRDWPFAKVAYPGRTIPWERWDALVAAGKPARASAPGTNEPRP